MKQRSGSGKRTTQHLSESLHKRLNAYALAASAAGVGVLALAQPAQAKIIYTPKNEQCPCLISLNNDGISDFAIFNADGDRERPGEHWGKYSVSELNIKGNRVWGNSHKSLSDGYLVQWAFALRSGALIRAVPPKNNQRRGAAMVSWRANSTGNGSFSTNLVGYWPNRQGRYLGLRFIISGKVHYGWARLNVSCDGHTCSASLTGYAYETIPNKPIIAGKTHGEEDGTLGRLAQGASGK
jgi:hypothetical protein